VRVHLRKKCGIKLKGVAWSEYCCLKFNMVGDINRHQGFNIRRDVVDVANDNA